MTSPQDPPLPRAGADHASGRPRDPTSAALILAGLALAVLTLIVSSRERAIADGPPPATYSATQTIPVPPASTFAGSGGGDGWALAIAPNAVYNVFHHAGTLEVACHLQTDASACWPPKTITDAGGKNFATSGQPGLRLDSATGRLYVYATRAPDLTGGVVCIDTTQPAANLNPFCGFTALTAAGDASSGTSGISDPAVVGSRWYAFNYVNGAAVTGTKNTLLCFDLTTLSACPSQPFTVPVGSGSVSSSTFPAPAVAAIGGEVIVPITAGGVDRLACFDGSAAAPCAGAWPVPLGFSFDSNNGAPFPLLDPSGTTTGLCLPSTGNPCFSMSGASVSTPPGMPTAISSTSRWNGPALVIGPRVYVPNGNTDAVDCYDYNASAQCSQFPKSFTNLSLLYTVNADPQRPACIWVNADGGSGQIQNFDAYSGGGCGQGPVRVLASSLVVPSAVCMPSTYTSLQVTSPARSAYASGSVAFVDASGNPIPGIADQPLDSTGTVSLGGFNLSTTSGLPQFLITLAGQQGAPGAVDVKLTWTGTNDPSCVKPGTTVTPGATPPPSTPTSAPVVAGSKPASVSTRSGNSSVEFTATINPGGLPTTMHFEYARQGGTTTRAARIVYDARTREQSVGSDFADHTITARVTDLVPNSTYHFRAVAANPAGTSPGADTSFKTASDPPPPPPVLAKFFNAVPISGTVYVLLPGAGHVAGAHSSAAKGVGFIPLTEARQLPVGTIFDATSGVARLTSATVTARKVQSGDFAAGLFRVLQARRERGLTELRLIVSSSAGKTCAKAGKAQTAAARALPRTVLDMLRSDVKGMFRTRGRFSSATVRGTNWTTLDRCDGTLTRVSRGLVVVADLRRHKTITLRAGRSYLAKAP